MRCGFWLSGVETKGIDQTDVKVDSFLLYPKCMRTVFMSFFSLM